jgi:NAD(P)-dependent dehydrogenase (short-subunit alcohol dehydrogenase family)
MINFISLSGKTILVIGASSGIGRAIALGAHEMGGKVVCASRRGCFDPPPNDLKENIQHEILDVTNFSLIPDFIKSLNLPIDGFVYAAGKQKKVPMHLLEKELLDDVLDTNLNGFLFIFKELIKQKKINNESSVVLISSIAAHTGTAAIAPYTISKSGLSSISKVLAREFSRKKIRINAISPAMVRTPIFEPSQLEWLDQLEKESYPLGLGAPEDIAAACVFLLSDKSNFVTGTDLIMTGGCEWIY